MHLFPHMDSLAIEDAVFNLGEISGQALLERVGPVEWTLDFPSIPFLLILFPRFKMLIILQLSGASTIIIVEFVRVKYYSQNYTVT